MYPFVSSREKLSVITANAASAAACDFFCRGIGQVIAGRGICIDRSISFHAMQCQGNISPIFF
jgi:hypothetical protein